MLFYITLVAPLAVVVIIECVIYIMTFAILSKTILTKASDERTHLLTSMAFNAIFTLGWGVGLAKLQTTGAAAAVLEAIFAATGGLMGLYVVLIYCVAVTNVRNYWKQWSFQKMESRRNSHMNREESIKDQVWQNYEADKDVDDDKENGNNFSGVVDGEDSHIQIRETQNNGSEPDENMKDTKL